MLDRPRKRICPSLICIAFSKTRRHDGGLRKGRRPSATSISASALMAMSQKPTSANGLLPRQGRRRRPRAATHRLEELAARVDDHDIALVAKARPIGLQAAIELGELRILAERIGEDGRGPGIALALDLLRVAIG